MIAQPISETDLTKNIPVCHSKMRSFEWVIDLIVRELSHKKWWSPENQVKYTNAEKESHTRARNFVKEEVFKTLAINIGNPGDMVTGNSFQTFSSDQARIFLCSLVDEDLREDLSIIHLGLCATVKVINSQKRKVNVDKLRELTKNVHLKNS